MILPVLVAALMQGAPSPAVKVPEGAALTAAIAARDAEFFATQFDRCEPERIAAMVTPDLEFYHDIGGRVAVTGEAYVADYRKACEARKSPDAWRSRRELVAGTMKVYPIPGYGAVEEGTHLFYERQGDGPEKLVGRARFSALWKLENGRWLLARVFSIDHAKVN